MTFGNATATLYRAIGEATADAIIFADREAVAIARCAMQPTTR